MSADSGAQPRNETQDTKSAGKVLQVLRVLERNFHAGYSPGELARETGLSPSAITRAVKTLEKAGYAERVPDTDRVRMSHRLGQVAVQIMHSLDRAKAEVEQSIQRITRAS